MSIKVITRVLDTCTQESSSARLTMLVLAERADDSGYCYPGIAKICARTKLSERHQKRVLTSLCESGDLLIDPGGGRNHTNGYLLICGLSEADVSRTLSSKFQLDPLKASAVAADAIARQKKGDTGDTNSDAHDTLSDTINSDMAGQNSDTQGKRVTPRAGNSDAHVTQYVKEPSVRTVTEPSVEEEENPLPHPAIGIYQEIFQRLPDKQEREFLSRSFTDFNPDRWREVCKLWAAKGWQAQMLSGLVDRYQRNAPARASPSLSRSGMPIPAPPIHETIELDEIEF